MSLFDPLSVCKPETAQKIRRSIMPFTEVEKYRRQSGEMKKNFRGLQPMDRMLLLFFILDSILLVAVAIYAPTLTESLGYSLWQFAQFGFLLYLAYRIGKHKNQACGRK